jgi:hypothetical protein
MKMYKTLLIVLAVAYIISFAFFVIQLIASFGGLFDTWWRGLWFVDDGYWVLGEFLVM